MRPEAPVPTVGQVVAVVDAQLGSGLLRCLEPGCGGRLVRWGFGVERDLVGLGGTAERVRPRRARGAAGGGGRGRLAGSRRRRRQGGGGAEAAQEAGGVGGGGHLGGGAVGGGGRGGPWNQIAAQLGVPYTTVREWLRRFARRADRVHAWLCGLLPRLVDDPVWPRGTPGAAGDALAVLGALHQQMPGRWPVVAGLSPAQLAARLSRCGLLAPSWPPGMINTSSPVT